jgi:hypothetical protein
MEETKISITWGKSCPGRSHSVNAPPGLPRESTILPILDEWNRSESLKNGMVIKIQFKKTDTMNAIVTRRSC